MNGKRTAINMISQLVSFVVGLGVSFVLTPYIAGRLGTEVYGFVGMAYQVTSYISVFTVAFNTMLNIFVATEYHKGKIEEANRYYSSVFYADIVIAVILFIPLTLISMYMEVFLDVPESSMNDIKLLWFFVFLMFLFNLALAPWGIATFIKNRVDLSARRTLESNIIKAVLMLSMFVFLAPKVWYIGFVSFVCGMYCIITNRRYMKKLVPEIRLDRKLFDWKYMKKLLSVGIWNTINQLTYILLSGLDLLISNTFINAKAMGYISYAQTVPVQIGNLVSMVNNIFTPQLTKTYAQGNMEEFEKELKSSIKISGFVCSIPILGFIAFGVFFYNLWIPSLTDSEVKTIVILSFLILFYNIFDVYISPLYAVNSITKHMKIPVIVTFCCGVVNIVAELILLKTTNLGVYAIEIATAAVMFFKVVIFTPTYAAKILNLKWYTFHKPLIRGVIATIITLTLYFTAAHFINVDSWAMLVVVAVVAAIVGYGINYLVVLGKSERSRVNQMISAKLFKKKNKKQA